MSKSLDQSNGSTAYATSNWQSFEGLRGDCPELVSSTGPSLGGGVKRHREQGPVFHSNQLLNNTIASAVTCGLDSLSPLMWPQQPGAQNNGPSYPAAATMHKYAGSAQESAAPATMTQPYLFHGCQQPVAPEASAGTTMLYGTFRQDHMSAADQYTQQSVHAASAAQMQNRMAAEHAHNHQQQRLLLLQRQQEEQAQQQLLLAQAQQLQQQQQAALARSAAAAATAGLAGARALYGNYCSMSAGQQQQWDGSAVNYSRQLQQQQMLGLQSQHVVSASDAGLPPRPAATHHAPSTWSDHNIAAVADAAKSARLALQELQDQNSNISSSSRFASNYQQQAAAAAAANAGRAGKGPVARWSGQLGIINATGPVPGSAESDANTGGFLECDEDLLSLEALDVYNQQPVPSHKSAPAVAQPSTHQRILQQPPNSRGMFSPEALPGYAQDTSSTNHRDSDDTMSDDDSEDDQPYANNRHNDPAVLDSAALIAARAAAVAADEAVASEHTVVLQVLGTVAEIRKGAPVLTAAPAHAAAAGAQSVRPRLLITEVSVYTEKGANSQLALNQANKLLNKMTLPDDITYMPVSSESFLFRAGAAWQFPAFVVCLGSSYLQRMFARLPQLAEAALVCPGFEDYCQYLPDTYQGITPRRLSGLEATSTLATLRSVQFTCLFLALKVADQSHALGLLSFMLTNLSHNGAVVSLQQAADVEARCLDALGWRLGPYFIEDDLTGDDELLWAESMGHWDYGTDRDSYPEDFN